MPPRVARLLLEVSGPQTEPVRPQVVVQMILYDPRLNTHPLLFGVQLDHTAHVLGEVDVNSVSDGLARKACGSASRQDRDLVARGDPADRCYVLLMLGDHNTDRLNLPDAGIGAVEDLRVLVEADLALDFLAELIGEIGGVLLHD